MELLLWRGVRLPRGEGGLLFTHARSFAHAAVRGEEAPDSPVPRQEPVSGQMKDTPNFPVTRQQGREGAQSKELWCTQLAKPRL